MRPYRRGFTLIELLVVIFMIGAMGALVVPRMSKMVVQARVQRAAQALQTDVQQAFAIAGRNRYPIKLTWNSSAVRLQVTSRDGSTVYRETGLGTNSGYGLTASDVTVSPATLQIFPNGLADAAMVITLSKEGTTRTLNVSRSGIVRLQ